MERCRRLSQHNLDEGSVKRHKKHFNSASQALDAYIEEFSGSQPQVKKYYREVNELLTPKTALELTSDRSLRTGLHDTPQEVRLYEIKKMVDHAYRNMVADDQHRVEVKTALEESSRLLKDISGDELPSLPSNSNSDNEYDVDSMTTDMLLSVSNGNKHSNKHTSGHVYSYRTKKPRTFSRSIGEDNLRTPDSRVFSTRSEGVTPGGGKENRQRLNFSESFGSKHALEKYSIQRRYSPLKSVRIPRLRSPNSILRKSLSPDKPRPLPSYIGELEMSHVTERGRVTPSWVGTLEDSVIKEGNDRTPNWVQNLDDSKSERFSHHSEIPMPHECRVKAPSWIDHLETSVVGGRRAPTWIGELDDSALASKGRHVPSYIGVLNESGVGKNSTSDTLAQDRHSDKKSKQSKFDSNKDIKGQSKAMSWFDCLDLGKHKDAGKESKHAPSWVGDLEVSAYNGRPNPSWIGDTTLSGITQVYTGQKLSDISSNDKASGLSSSLSSSRSEKLSLDDLRTTPRSFYSQSHDSLVKSKEIFSNKKSTGDRLSTKKNESSRPQSARLSSRDNRNDDLNPGRSGGAKKSGAIQFDYSSSARKHSTTGSRACGPSSVVKPGVYENNSSSSKAYPRRSVVDSTPRSVNKFKPGVYENTANNEKQWELRGDEVENHLTESEIKILDCYGSDKGRNDLLGTTREAAEKRKQGNLTSLTLSPIKLADHSTDYNRPLDSPPSTDIILDGDRTWERIPQYKSPKYVTEVKQSLTGNKAGVLDNFMEDCLTSDEKKSSPRLTGREQPGGMEALKNMLFTLQAVASSADDLVERDDPLPVETTPELPPTEVPIQDNFSASTKQVWAEQFIAEPGGKSLEKAMLHLSRLKSLVTLGSSDETSSGGDL